MEGVFDYRHKKQTKSSGKRYRTCRDCNTPKSIYSYTTYQYICNDCAPTHASRKYNRRGEVDALITNQAGIDFLYKTSCKTNPQVSYLQQQTIERFMVSV